MRVFSKAERPISKFIRSAGLALAVCIGSTAMPPTAFAQMSSYEQQKVIQFLRTPRTEMKLNIFDGTNFTPGTDKTRAYNYMVDFINAMNKANRIVGTMTSHAKGTTEGRAFLNENKQKLDYARAMQAAYPAFEKGEAKPAAADATASDTPAAASDAGTTMMARERESVQQHLDLLNAMEADGTFDGSQFASSVSVDASRSFYKAYAKSMQDATNALNKLSGDARRTDEGREFTTNVKRRIALASTIYDSLASHRQAVLDAEKALPAIAETATVTVHLDEFDTLLNTGPFDGATFNEGTSLDEADRLVSALADSANAATKAFNALPAKSQRSENGRLLIEKIREYQNKRRPAQSALDDYRRVRAPIEAAAADTIQKERVAHCRVLQGAFGVGASLFQRVVIEVEKSARESGWESISEHPSLQGINEDWGSEALEVSQLCSRKRYSELADINFECSHSVASDHIAWCRTAVAYAQTNEQAYAELAARAAAIQSTCNAYKASVMTRENRRAMKRLFKLSDRNMYDPKLPDTIRFANTVETACSTPEFDEIVEVDCGSAEPLDNPTAWCRASIDGKNVLRRRIAASFETKPMWSARTDTIYGNEDKLLRNGGWLTPDTKVSYASLFSYERSLMQPQSNNQSLLETLELLGVDPKEFSTYEDTLDVIDDVTATIEENAGSWPKTPVKEDYTGYVTKLAAEKLVNNWHPTAKVEGTWLGSSEWNIERTGLGFLDNRWVNGYVMLKLPEDPYCQLHMIFVTEKYDGEKFVQSPDIQTKKVRFQNCDRR